MEAVEDTLAADIALRIARGRKAIRVVERLSYRLVSDAVGPDDIEEAKSVLRLTIGLRRKLDAWR